MVKITDVAARAGVAKSTVSNVLTGRKYVSEELRQKVLKACQELDFHPNFYAAGLSSKKTNILALVLSAKDDIAQSPFYGELLVACVTEASKHGYSLITYCETDTAKLLSVLRQGRAPIDGAIIAGPCVDDERFAQLENDRTHCVAIGHPSGYDNMSYVDIDNKKFVYEVVKNLAQTYSGDAFLLNSAPNMTISIDRDQGFVSACEEQNKSVDGKIVHFEHCGEKDGYDFVAQHATKDSVFIVANDVMCKGVYKAIKDKGLQVGKDVGVFALGRNIESGSFEPKLSYGKQDYSQIGKLVVQLLIDELENKRESQAQSKVIYADNQLVFRDSTSK